MLRQFRTIILRFFLATHCFEFLNKDLDSVEVNTQLQLRKSAKLQLKNEKMQLKSGKVRREY